MKNRTIIKLLAIIDGLIDDNLEDNIEKYNIAFNLLDKVIHQCFYIHKYNPWQNDIDALPMMQQIIFHTSYKPILNNYLEYKAYALYCFSTDLIF